MNMIKCERGHQYSPDNPKCPICGAGPAKAFVSGMSQDFGSGPDFGASQGQFGASTDGATLPLNSDIFSNSSPTAGFGGAPQMTAPSSTLGRLTGVPGGMATFGSVPSMDADIFAGRGGQSSEDRTRPLLDPVGAAASGEDRTIGIYAPVNNVSSRQFFGGYAQPEKPVPPVVGWLVCVEGPSIGRSYILHEGRNFIGRNEQYDINLEGDNTVSRSVHAIVIFEPKQKVFYGQTGEATSLLYRNGEVVLTNVKLNDRDVLEVGDTKLMFVPFCDERFCWEARKADDGE